MASGARRTSGGTWWRRIGYTIGYTAMIARARDVTPRQLAAVRALLDTGTTKGAAEQLGISPLTVRDLLADARVRSGVETNEQLVLMLSRRGRLSVPRAQLAGVAKAV